MKHLLHTIFLIGKYLIQFTMYRICLRKSRILVPSFVSSILPEVYSIAKSIESEDVSPMEAIF